MKTSILVSSIAAFFLMITFGGTPDQKREGQFNQVSSDNFSILPVHLLTPVAEINLATEIKMSTEPIAEVAPVENFDYIKFDVSDYIAYDAASYDESVVIPEYSGADYSYLKFDVNEYTGNSAPISSEITELPESESNTLVNSKFKAAENEFSYLKFDVNSYIESSESRLSDSDELPANEFDYLKFDAEKFNIENNSNSDVNILLPQSE